MQNQEFGLHAKFKRMANTIIKFWNKFIRVSVTKYFCFQTTHFCNNILNVVYVISLVSVGLNRMMQRRLKELSDLKNKERHVEI